jgi:hypothetical protein
MTAFRSSVLWVVLVGLAPAMRAADEPGFTEFEAKVKSYSDMVDRMDRKVGRLPDRADAERVHAHKRALAEEIAKERAGAHAGDIFTPAERPRFVQIVRGAMGGPAGAPARKAIAEDNPTTAKNTPRVTVAPNAEYPEGAPLSTVPPTLLLRLPALPKTLDYRFVGKTLVLRDTRANLIVDYIPDALP